MAREYGEGAMNLPKTRFAMAPDGAAQTRAARHPPACREAGADNIFVAGLEADARKLEIARAFGADATIDVQLLPDSGFLAPANRYASPGASNPLLAERAAAQVKEKREWTQSRTGSRTRPTAAFWA